MTTKSVKRKPKTIMERKFVQALPLSKNATEAAKIAGYKDPTQSAFKDRKLHIGGNKAWFLIEKGKNEVSEIIDRFEPGLNTDNTTNSDALKLASSFWLGARDSNPNNWYQKPESCR